MHARTAFYLRSRSSQFLLVTITLASSANSIGWDKFLIVKAEPESHDMMTANGEQNHVELETVLLPIVKVEIPDQFPPSDEEFEDENNRYRDENEGWCSAKIKEECVDNSSSFPNHQSESSDSGNYTSTILHKSQFICVQDSSEKCSEDSYTKSSQLSRVSHENSISLNPLEIKNECSSPVQTQDIKQECSDNDSLTWHEASDQSCTEYKVFSDASDKCIDESSQPNRFLGEKQLSPKQVQNNSEKKVYRCDICKSIFKSRFNLIRHINAHAGIRPYECKICNTCFSRPYTLNQHVKTHSVERCYKCKSCDKVFKTTKTLSRHVRSVHEGRLSFRCEYCNQGFRWKPTLMHHQQIYHMKRGSVCEICEKEFPTNSALSRHKRRHTRENEFPCQTCPKVLCSKHNLILHERLHTGEKPFTCHVCEKTFIQKHLLLRHVIRHHPVDDLQNTT